MIYSFWFPVVSLRFCNTMKQFKAKTLKVTIRANLSRLSQNYSFYSLNELIPKKGIFSRSGDHHTHDPGPKNFYIITASIGILPNFFGIVIISLYNSLWRVRRVLPICNKRTLLYNRSSLLFNLFLKKSSDFRNRAVIVLISFRSMICIRPQVRNFNWAIDTPYKKRNFVIQVNFVHLSANTD